VVHISVYRRWRPKTFEEIIGQERITHTLQNALRTGRTTHAYLFAGHRGTGKTTTARIFAKALNCAQGPTPTPDNTCPSCEAIARGTSMDVIEIDGASNTSVDDIRDLKEKIVLGPTHSRCKVYIIDEVHMLSTSAFNALLKTLEEPPQHAVFILVTTEPHKIPSTVLSRCQRFDFRRVSFAEIVARVRMIAQQEGITIDEAALAQIVRSADGSVRDAESVLDQLSAYTDGTIDLALVTGVLGLVDEETASTLADATLARDVGATLRLAQEATNAGKDARQVLRTLLEYFRDLLLVKTCGPAASGILDAPKERFAQLQTQTERTSVADLLRAVRVLNDAFADARWSTQPRLALEVALIRMARPEMDPSVEGLLTRVERLEAAQTREPRAADARGGDMSPAPAESPVPERATPAPPPAPLPPRTPPRKPTPRADAAEPRPVSDLVTIDEVRRQWARVLEEVKRTKMICHALLIEGTPMEVDGSTLVVGLRSAYNFHVDNLHRPENRDVVEGALTRVLGRSLRFQCRLIEGAVPAPAAAAATAPATSLVARARELFGAEIVEEKAAE
jgi:DNA polymerase-3 subunit gamma/tau